MACEGASDSPKTSNSPGQVATLRADEPVDVRSFHEVLLEEEKQGRRPVCDNASNEKK